MKISYLCHTLNASFQEYVVCQIVSSGHAHIIPIISSYLNFSSGELCMLLNFEMLPRCFSITIGWKLSKEYVHFLSCFPKFEKQSYYISNYVKNKELLTENKGYFRNKFIPLWSALFVESYIKQIPTTQMSYNPPLNSFMKINLALIPWSSSGFQSKLSKWICNPISDFLRNSVLIWALMCIMA